MNIYLHVERLIVDEALLGAGRHDRLQAAVEAELTRLLTEGGMADELARGATLASTRAGQPSLARANEPHYLGRQIARGIYGGISS